MYNRRFSISPDLDIKPTTDLFIPSIIDRRPCGRHMADFGVPCFRIPTMVGKTGFVDAVCNKRARVAGYNASINPKSLRMA